MIWNLNLTSSKIFTFKTVSNKMPNFEIKQSN